MARGSKIVSNVTSINDGATGGDRVRSPDRSSPEDKLNSSIVAALQHDGRRAFSEIAHDLGVSEGTIRNRVASMKQAGMLRIVAIVDPVVSEYKTDAMLGVKIAPGYTPHQVAERLAAVSDVVYILWVSGRFDLLVEVVSNDREGFLSLLNSEIHGQDDISSVETMTGMKNFKNQFLLKSDWESNDG